MHAVLRYQCCAVEHHVLCSLTDLLNAHSWITCILPFRSFMSRRSDYFSAMLGSSFQEGASTSGDMLEIQVTDVEAGVLYAALRWVYTDRVDADMPAHQLLQVSYLLASSAAHCVLGVQDWASRVGHSGLSILGWAFRVGHSGLGIQDWAFWLGILGCAFSVGHSGLGPACPALNATSGCFMCAMCFTQPRINDTSSCIPSKQ